MITDRLYLHATTQASKAFILFESEEITYGQMAVLVARFANELREEGVSQGDRVAIICGNRPEFLIAWFALNELGAIAVPLNVSLVGDGLRYTLKQCEARLILVEDSLHPQKSADIDAVESITQTLLITQRLREVPSATVPRWTRKTPIAPLDPACILYTSGTTGLPKGVVLPHKAYMAAGADMVASLEMQEHDRIMVFLPLFHANPQMYAVMSVLEVGATLIILPRFSASGFFEDAQRYRATGFTFVGTVLSILEKAYPGAQRDHSLKWGVGGGAPERVWREIQDRFNIRVNELYGMTETGGWVSMNTAQSSRLGSVGGPRKAVTLSIRNESGVEVPQGEKGEIVVKSSTSGLFFTEYWNNQAATGEVLKNGCLYTGDRGYLDADGFLYFDGRVKELIRRGGEMIAPAEVEQQLLKHSHIKDCAVVGVADEIMGEEVKVAVVTSAPLSADELREFLSDRLPHYMIPRYVSFVDAIPKTETQKIKRHELNFIDSATIDTKAKSGAA